MTKCAELQMKMDRALTKALEQKDQNLKRFFFNAAKGYEAKLKKLEHPEEEA